MSVSAAAAAAVEPPSQLATSRPSRAALLRNRPLIIGLTIIMLMLIASFVIPALWHQGPRTADPIAPSAAPSWSHPFGTDDQGFDVFVRTFYAPRIDITLAAAGVGISVVLGVLLGVFAGFSRGLFGSVVLRLTDVVQAFPLLILALVLVALAGNSFTNIIWAIVLVNTPMFLRLTRNSVLGLRELRFVDAAVALGNPPWKVVLRHILPNAIGPVIVQAGVNLGLAILTIAALAFLGVGIQVPTPEWGSMILVGRDDISTGQWWTAVFPGIALALTVIAFNLIADGVEQAREVRR